MKWLHISDVHFANLGYSTEELRLALLKKLKETNEKLDFIIITGDCFYKEPWYRVPLRCDYRCYITIKSGGEGKVVDSLDIM